MAPSVGVLAVCVGMLLVLPAQSDAFVVPQPQQQRHYDHLPPTALHATKSKPPRNKRFSGSNSSESNSGGAWNKLKKIVYDGVDSVSSMVDENNKKDSKYSNVQKGRISQGYESGLKQRRQQQTGIPSSFGNSNIPMSPAERILMKEQQPFASGVRQSAGVTSIQQRQRQQREQREQRSSFDNFKAGIYGVVDFVTGPAPSRTTKKAGKQSRREAVSVSVQENDDEESSESSTSTLAVPSKPSFNQIREQEARARAEVRNEKIRAKKDILYKYVDKLQDSVDALPETCDSAEEAVKEAIQFSKTIPDKLGNTVNEVIAIPGKIEQKASRTQQSIQDGINNVNQSYKNTKATLESTQETARDMVTRAKVMAGLEKPQPKPPKTPPPPRKKPKEIALDLAGKAAGSTASLAWKGTKLAFSVVGKGAKVAYDKSMESIGPAIEDAFQQRQQEETTAAVTKEPLASNDKVAPAPPPIQEVANLTNDDASNRQKKSKNIETPEQLAKEVADAQALAKEVEEALEMAERALQISSKDRIPKDGRGKQ